MSPAKTRTPPRPASTNPGEVGTLVPHHTSTWLRDSALLATTGVGGSAALALTDHAWMATLVLPASIAAASGLALQGARRQRRRDLEYRVRQALAPVLGLRRVDHAAVRLSRWEGPAASATPARILVRYASGAPDDDPAWLSTVIKTVSRRLGADYVVESHDRRRCVVTLARVWGEVKPAAQQRLEEILSQPAQLGASAAVSDILIEDGQVQAFSATYAAATTKFASPAQRRAVSARIGALTPGRWRAQWDIENDRVRFEVRPTLPDSIWLPVPQESEGLGALSSYDSLAIPVADDEDGRQVCWRPRFSPHALFVGTTGSGKTSTMHAVVAQFTKRGWPVWVVDAKRVEFLSFRDWPNVQIVAGKSQAGRARLDGVIPQQVAVVSKAWQVMQHRLELLENGQASEKDFEPLLLVIDEFTEFRANLLAWYAQVKRTGEPRHPKALEDVASLLRLARTTRIHLLIGMQRPDIELLGGGEMRDNLRFRLSMGRLSPKGAQMMWENVTVGTTLPNGRVGRAITLGEDGEYIEVQCHRFPSLTPAAGSEEERLLRAIRPSHVTHPRLVIDPPKAGVLASGAEVPLRYIDYADATWHWASDRPDLDPLTQAPPTAMTPQERRDLASPAASLGLTTAPADKSGAAAGRPCLRLGKTSLQDDTDEIPVVGDQSRFPYDDETAGTQDIDPVGYGEPMSLGPYDLEPGDRIEIEPGTWAVVEETIDDGDGLVAISWRSDNDDSGLLSVSEGDLLDVQRPLDDGMDPF